MDKKKQKQKVNVDTLSTLLPNMNWLHNIMPREENTVVIDPDIGNSDKYHYGRIYNKPMIGNNVEVTTLKGVGEGWTPYPMRRTVQGQDTVYHNPRGSVVRNNDLLKRYMQLFNNSDKKVFF